MTNLISEVKAALQKLPPAPWEVWEENGQVGVMASPEGPNICTVGKYGWGVMPEAEFIANSPTWLQQLIERIETTERQREEAVKALEWYGDPENHEHPETGYYEVKNPPAWDDEGELARTTLKRIKGENG